LTAAEKNLGHSIANLTDLANAVAYPSPASPHFSTAVYNIFGEDLEM